MTLTILLIIVTCLQLIVIATFGIQLRRTQMFWQDSISTISRCCDALTEEIKSEEVVETCDFYDWEEYENLAEELKTMVNLLKPNYN